MHRPRYDDWTFPKGKARPGESDVDCALREVEEETGLRCELVRELPSTSYVDGKGRPKLVRYWLMRPTGEAGPANEVDAVRWATRDEAARPPRARGRLAGGLIRRRRRSPLGPRARALRPRAGRRGRP